MISKKKVLTIVLALVVGLQLTAFTAYSAWASDDQAAGKTPVQTEGAKDASGEAAGESISADEEGGAQAEKPEAGEANGPFAEGTDGSAADGKDSVNENGNGGEAAGNAGNEGEQQNNVDRNNADIEELAQKKVNAALAALNGLKAAPAKAEVEDLTVYITGILYINGQVPESSVNGHAVAYTRTMTMTPGQSKAAKGFLNSAGGTNTSAGGFGADYKSLGVLTKSSEGADPVIWETASDGPTIDRVYYNNDGSVTIKYTNGEKEELGKTTKAYVAPVYKRTINWYLIYNYNDNISTGSGSWSNLDFVTQYSHTYSDPSEKTPVNHYKFVNWKNRETGDTYEAGETHTYTGAEQPSGSTKTINIDAMWQPSVTVNWHAPDNSKIDKTEESFDQDTGIGAYEYVPENITVDDIEYKFDGWYDKDGKKVEENAAYKAPEITSEPVEQYVVDLYPRYVTKKEVAKVWDDDNNRDGIRPETLTVQLYQNGEPLGDAVDLSAGEDGEEGWTYTFEDLTAFDEDGEPYVYKVDEVKVPEGYEEKDPESTTLKDTLVNVHEPEKLDIAVTKVWDDNNDKEGKRPDSVKVVLKADGSEADAAEITEKAAWKHTFEGVYKYEAGKEIEYTVDEADVPSGYKARVTGTVEDGFTVTNTLPSKSNPKSDTDSDKDKDKNGGNGGKNGKDTDKASSKTATGDVGFLGLLVSIFIVSGMLLTLIGRRRKSAGR